jgi:exopolyphosphatase/guanosine-5'-triphosphate,3'-diphosphate pyrophosphatase
MAGAPVRVAAVDIGTNTVKLLIGEGGAGPGDWRDHRVVVTGLGRGVDATGLLAEESIVRTLEALRGFGETIRVADVARARAVATSAARDAGNSGHFLDRAEVALGFRPEIIDGAGEARLSFAGATYGLDAPAPCLVIDPGGGSTEFVYGTEQPEAVHSVDIGSVRLTERMLPERPADTADVLAAAAMVDAVFGTVSLPGTPATVIGVGGTFTSLAAIALDLHEHDPRRVHGSRMTLTGLGELIDRLSAMTVEETAAIRSLDPARAPVLLAGAVVAEGAVRRSGCDSVVVSETDILHGIAGSLLG